MRKPALTLAALALGLSVITGCGGGEDTAADDTQAYCDKLEAGKDSFEAFSGGDVDPDKLGEAITMFHDLADAAPEAVAPDWDLLDATLSKVERALAEAGITTEDLAGLQSGKLPKGVDMAKLASLAAELKALTSTELEDAAKSIKAHAKSECGVTLEGR